MQGDLIEWYIKEEDYTWISVHIKSYQKAFSIAYITLKTFSFVKIVLQGHFYRIKVYIIIDTTVQ